MLCAGEWTSVPSLRTTPFTKTMCLSFGRCARCEGSAKVEVIGSPSVTQYGTNRMRSKHFDCASNSFAQDPLNAICYLVMILKMLPDRCHLRGTPRGATLAALHVQSLPPQYTEITFRESHGLLQLDVRAFFGPHFHKVGIGGSCITKITDCRRRAEEQVDHL